MPVVNDSALEVRAQGSLRLSSTSLEEPVWVNNTNVLWDHRRTLFRVAICALLLSTTVAFLLPKQYESTARIMPPDQSGGGTALIAALAGKSMLGGGLGALASSFFGLHNSSALFVELLQSTSVRGDLVDQFDLQKVYRSRYRFSAIKRLAHRTDITEDRKSGVITITVTDTDRRRARDMTQAYLDQLDGLLIRVNTSAARRERQFIEQRLITVKAELEKAQLELSDYSSKNTTLDVKEQTKAMVDAGAKLQAQLIVARSERDSLEQIYSPNNVRVRATQARVSELERELQKLAGSSTASSNLPEQDDAGTIYPPLRQLPVLAVRWADLYRRVRVSETVFDLLTEEYETARIEEAKSIPTVSVIDSPTWPEKKSFPPRVILILSLTFTSVFIVAVGILMAQRWRAVDVLDPRKMLAERIWISLRNHATIFRPNRRPAE
jgi:capsule polysaccharide export protein KpsE/RkpR